MSVRSLRYNTIEQHFTKSALASTDRDALAFLEAAQIYNTNQQRAIVNLVRSLKRTGLWTKMKAIYPFVGGTATSHKWNLKDPRDVDAAFRLTFSGGWTHSSTGALPNGTNAYGDSFLIPNSNLTLYTTHIAYYSRTQTTAINETEIGVSNTFGTELPILQMYFLRTANTTVSDHYSYNVNRLTATNTITTGLLISNRTSSTVHNMFLNSLKLGTDTTSSSQTSMPTAALILGAYRLAASGSGFQYARFSTKECAFATIGDGLTDTDATNLYNIVDLYQKRLGRAV